VIIIGWGSVLFGRDIRVPSSQHDTPVFILCGGQGTRLREETEFRPKPMVNIGDRPILWHIMRLYAEHGFRKFILCLGFKGEMIKSYFLSYSHLHSDLRVDLRTNQITVLSTTHEDEWEVTLADTGKAAMTGARVARAAAKYLDGAENFAVTYGDGLTNASLADEFAFHRAHGKIGTILGVNPPSRFGELRLRGTGVAEFREKPIFQDEWINGGYFFFKRDFLKYLGEDDACVLEREPLVRVAEDSELEIYRHEGFWACMDTQRDREDLNALWDSGRPPWTVPGGPTLKSSLLIETEW
jgi:glucose-1-phosphate cytidylyltransferase